MEAPPNAHDEVRFLILKANGITHRVAIAGRKRARTTADTSLVLLLHGWPEGWYSWRRQLVALAASGYLVAAPDLRGYGGTDAPPDVASYDIHTLAADVIAVASAIMGGEHCEKFVVVGHDFGSYLAYHVALLHPNRIAGVCLMSVPYIGHTPSKLQPIANLIRRYGDPLADDKHVRRQARYHYILHHQLPSAAAGYDDNAYEALRRLYAYRPGVSCVPGTPEVTDPRMYPHSIDDSHDDDDEDAWVAPGVWSRLPRPARLPDWLTEADLEHCASEFKRSGFGGGLRWYQSLDRNWEATRYLSGRKLAQPVLFLCGAEDDVLRAHGGSEFVRRRMQEETCEELTDFFLLEGAGHWIQQECAEAVNVELLRFLSSLSKSCWSPQQNLHSRL